MEKTAHCIAIVLVHICDLAYNYGFHGNLDTLLMLRPFQLPQTLTCNSN